MQPCEKRQGRFLRVTWIWCTVHFVQGFFHSEHNSFNAAVELTQSKYTRTVTPAVPVCGQITVSYRHAAGGSVFLEGGIHDTDLFIEYHKSTLTLS